MTKQPVESLGMRRLDRRGEQVAPPAQPTQPYVGALELSLERGAVLAKEVEGEHRPTLLLRHLAVVGFGELGETALQAVEQEVDAALRRIPGDTPRQQPAEEVRARAVLPNGNDLPRRRRFPGSRIGVGEESTEHLQAIRITERRGPLV